MRILGITAGVEISSTLFQVFPRGRVYRPFLHERNEVASRSSRRLRHCCAESSREVDYFPSAREWPGCVDAVCAPGRSLVGRLKTEMATFPRGSPWSTR